MVYLSFTNTASKANTELYLLNCVVNGKKREKERKKRERERKKKKKQQQQQQLCPVFLPKVDNTF